MRKVAKAGSFRRIASAAGSGDSDYLTTILAPFLGSGAIPDTNMTGSFPKATSFSDNFLVIGSGGALYMYLPHSKNKPLRMYLYLPNPGLGRPAGYYYLKNITLDQDLSTDFTFGRFVSGGFSVQSATIAAGAFAVAGTCNACAIQEFPDILSMTFNQISSHKRNEIDVKVGVPASQGVTCIASPDSDNRYTVFDTTETFNVDGIIRVFDNLNPLDNAGPSGWNVAPLGNLSSNTFYQTALQARGAIIPPNAWGQIDIHCAVNVQISIAVAGVLTVVMTARGWNTVDGVNAVPVTKTATVLLDLFVGTNLPSTDLFIFWNSDTVLEQVDVVGTLSTPATNPWQLRYGTTEMKFWEYYDEGFNRTGFLVGFDGLTVGQTLTVSGVENDEVIPNSNLAKNIPTSYFGPFRPFELEMVSSYLANATENKLRFLWTTDEYRMWVMSRGFEQHTSISHIATASGFSNMMGMILGGLKVGMPLLGGYVGGPIGTALGNLAGQVDAAEMQPAMMGTRFLPST